MFGHIPVWLARNSMPAVMVSISHQGRLDPCGLLARLAGPLGVTLGDLVETGRGGALCQLYSESDILLKSAYNSSHTRGESAALRYKQILRGDSVPGATAETEVVLCQVALSS